MADGIQVNTLSSGPTIVSDETSQGQIILIKEALGTDGKLAGDAKFAPINANTTGNTAVVAAVVGKKVRVVNVFVMAADVVTLKFQRGTTDITGPVTILQNGGFAPGEAKLGHFETGVNEALNINLSGNVQVGGWLTYVEE